jgi:uncharacterized protein
MQTRHRLTIDALRRYAVARSLFPPTTLPRALARMGFVQADPIRAPARAQDLILRHRVRGYRAGDLEERYASLGIAEDFFVNYGFVSHAVHDLMHPRSRIRAWTAARRRRAEGLLAFIHERGSVHPREVEAHFGHGTVVNYWGGSSNATTHLLDLMHYRGLLRVAGRDGGTRIYAPRDATEAAVPLDADAKRERIDALVDVAIGVYAPLPARTLAQLVSRLRFAVPQWHGELRAALRRARSRLAHGKVGETDWSWPAGEKPGSGEIDDSVRLLAPFDPVVWDRARFETFWGWAYRFEAYTPAARRKLGYYALPLLWRGRVIGWGNLAVREDTLHATMGYVRGTPPRERAFRSALDDEIERMRRFLRAASVESARREPSGDPASEGRSAPRARRRATEAPPQAPRFGMSSK